MDSRPIGIFDSGLGGLTALKELRRLLPQENLIYFGDTGRVPYGARSPQTLRRFAMENIRFLQNYDVKMIIAACGTISSIMTDEMAGGWGIPFTGVVKAAALAACGATRSGVHWRHRHFRYHPQRCLFAHHSRNAASCEGDRLRLPLVCPTGGERLYRGKQPCSPSGGERLFVRFFASKAGHPDFGLHPLSADCAADRPDHGRWHHFDRPREGNRPAGKKISFLPWPGSRREGRSNPLFRLR